MIRFEGTSYRYGDGGWVLDGLDLTPQRRQRAPADLAQHLARLLGGTETRDHLDRHREGRKALAEGLPVLVGEHQIGPRFQITDILLHPLQILGNRPRLNDG